MKGSLNKDRVFINDKKVRDLLLKFSGIDRKTRKVSTPVTEMSQEEFSLLLVRLKQKGHEGLASFIDSVVSDGGPSNSPPMYRKFFYELSHNSPLCGVFQIADHAECLDLIKCILDGTIVLTDSDRRCDLEILQSHAPIMAEFLASATKHGHLRFATRLIVDILSCCSAVSVCLQNLEFGVFGNDKLKQSSVFFSFMEIHKIIQQQNYNNVLKCLKHIGFPTSTKFQLAIQY